jgi:hypothetical protein
VILHTIDTERGRQPADAAAYLAPVAERATQDAQLHGERLRSVPKADGTWYDEIGPDCVIPWAVKVTSTVIDYSDKREGGGAVVVQGCCGGGVA